MWLETEFEQIWQQSSHRFQTLESEVNSINNKIKKLEEKADETEAYRRRDTIILSEDGIPACATTENCNQVLIDILKI